MINVTFSYNAQTSQTFRYKGNTKIKVPCNKFCKKIGIKISSVYFVLNGINLDESQMQRRIIDFTNNYINDLNILVYDYNNVEEANLNLNKNFNNFSTPNFNYNNYNNNHPTPTFLLVLIQVSMQIIIIKMKLRIILVKMIIIVFLIILINHQMNHFVKEIRKK